MIGELIAEGRTSEVYRHGNDGALKLLKSEVPQHWAGTEANLTDSVRSIGVPAPEVREVLTFDGRAGIVFKRVRGESMWERIVGAPADAPVMARELLDLQQTIHSLGVPAGLPNTVDRLSGKLATVDELSVAELGEAEGLMSELPSGAALLHGDLHPGNVLMSGSEMFVIDWFDASVGHPAADFARSLLLLEPSGVAGDEHVADVGRELVNAVHAAYSQAAEVAGPDREVVASWLRLQAAGRIAEGTGASVSALLEVWRGGAQR